MTLEQFENGYWYATELRDFLVGLGVLSARRLRKDQLETIVKRTIQAGRPETAPRQPRVGGIRDVDRGLSLDLPIVRYTSDTQTKQFIQTEAAKIVPGFRRAPGTRYLLNRWREAQINAGRPITYRDLVMKAIALNEEKKGPLRIEHGRYMNFISDYMATNKNAAHADAVRAWHEVKRMDAPKTYAAWAARRRRR